MGKPSTFKKKNQPKKRWKIWGSPAMLKKKQVSCEKYIWILGSSKKTVTLERRILGSSKTPSKDYMKRFWNQNPQKIGNLRSTFQGLDEIPLKQLENTLKHAGKHPKALERCGTDRNFIRFRWQESISSWWSYQKEPGKDILKEREKI